MDFILSLFFSGVAGFLAGRIMDNSKKRSSIIGNIFIGLIGGTVGNTLFGLVGFGATSLLGELIVSVIGACLCIWIWRKIRR